MVKCILLLIINTRSLDYDNEESRIGSYRRMCDVGEASVDHSQKLVHISLLVILCCDEFQISKISDVTLNK